MLSMNLLICFLVLLRLGAAVSLPVEGAVSEQYSRFDPSNKRKPSTTCSANQSGAIPDWASNPAWAANMTDCLHLMRNGGWNGADCRPATADGTPLGPTFGFWKGEDHYNDGGMDCYEQCEDCLMQGIKWQQAQTTNCHYKFWSRIESRHKHCNMGFDYGTWTSIAKPGAETETGTATE